MTDKMFRVDIEVVASARYSTYVMVRADSKEAAAEKAWATGHTLFAYDFKDQEPSEFDVSLVSVKDVYPMLVTLYVVHYDTASGKSQVTYTKLQDAVDRLKYLDPTCNPYLTVEKGEA